MPAMVESIDVPHVSEWATNIARLIPIIVAQTRPSRCFTPWSRSDDRNYGSAVTFDGDAWLGFYTSCKHQNTYKCSCSHKPFQHARHFFILSFLYPHLSRTRSKLPMSAFHTTSSLRKLEEIRITSCQGHPGLTEWANHLRTEHLCLHGPNLLHTVVSKKGITLPCSYYVVVSGVSCGIFWN